MTPAPDPSAPWFAWVLLAPALGAGLFLPGFLLLRRLSSPLPWITAFVGSGLVLFHAALLLNATPLRLNLVTLGGLLLLAALIGWRLGPGPLPTTLSRPRLPNAGAVVRAAWWVLPASLAAVSVLAHGLAEPLSGHDNFFRWNYLAQLMHAQGSLAHYPPVTGDDFLAYAWCDGIPPLVPLVNLWIYLATGSTASVLIVGRLAVELGLTAALVWHLARRLWGPAGGPAAILALSTSTLFLTSIGMQQETGMTGIALLALAALLLEYRQSPARSTARWIALTAAFGALCRDYNLLLIPAALAGLAAAGASRRHVVDALILSVLVTAPWYLRNAWLTGNPLFPHALGGLLPSNAAYHDFMAAIQGTYTYANPELSRALLRGLLLGAGVLVLLALPGLCCRRREARLIAGLFLIPLGLCAIAVPSTAGGPYYALRVLGAGLPLLAVAAGRWAIWLSGRQWLALGLCLLPFTADAARRSWIFVWAPDDPPWPYTWKTWSRVDAFIENSRHDPIWPRLAAVARGEYAVVMHPSYQVLLGQAGGQGVTMFSPDVGALLARDGTSLAEAIHALRERHVRFVLLVDDHFLNTRFLQEHPVTRQLVALAPTVQHHELRIYDLARIDAELAHARP